jgi:hypothetical protein
MLDKLAADVEVPPFEKDCRQMRKRCFETAPEEPPSFGGVSKVRHGENRQTRKEGGQKELGQISPPQSPFFKGGRKKRRQ